MLNQIIRQQSIILLNKIINLQPQQSQQNKNRNIRYLNESKYIQILLRKSILKNEQAKLIHILINGYKQIQKQNKQKQKQQNNQQDVQQSNTLTEQDIYHILKQIKRNIQSQQSQLLAITIIQLQKESKIPQKEEQKQKQSKDDQNVSKVIKQRQYRQQIIPLKNNQSVNKKRRDFQIIKRNIMKIKSYSTNNNPSSLQSTTNITSNNPYLQSQQAQLSLQISQKLFYMYSPIHPSQSKQTSQLLSFQLKQQYKSTLNYHKILQIFIDLGLNSIEVDKKLAILRIIKKYSFNPQFITQEEWTKIYKNVINMFGFKQIMLLRFIKEKQQEKKRPFTLIKEKQKNSQISFVNNSSRKQQNYQGEKQRIKYRTRKIKTQTSIANNYDSNNMYQSKILRSQMSIDNHNKDSKPYNMINKSGIRRIDQIHNNSTLNNSKLYNPKQYRLKHKKLITQVDDFTLRNLKSNLKPLKQKLIGIQNQKKTTPVSQFTINQNQNNQNEQVSSYLNKAIKSKKINKITWESLFNMNQFSMYHNIVVPEFVKFQPDAYDQLIEI